MTESKGNMDAQERKIKQQAKDINPKKDNIPDSLAEATTASLENNELGGNATQDDVKKDK